MAQKPEVKSINSISKLPEPPAGQKYSFKPAVTVDQARGVCVRAGVNEGWWMKNRVYFLPSVEKAVTP